MSRSELLDGLGRRQQELSWGDVLVLPKRHAPRTEPGNWEREESSVQAGASYARSARAKASEEAGCRVQT